MAFLEDYDMHLAHVLVQGVDLWLNLPRVPLEASGTSGMKAALNGVPQLSTIDGWWEEGFDGTNGWAIPPRRGLRPRTTDAADAEQLLPAARGARSSRSTTTATRSGVPLGWVETDAARDPGRGQPLHRAPDGAGLRRSEYYAPAMRGDGPATIPRPPERC